MVVVSVCVVFCALCCLQNNPVFSSVTILYHISKNENYELCISAGFFVDQITTGKNYDQKKGAGARLLLRPEKKVLVVCLAGARLLLQPEKKVLAVCLAGARSLLQPEKKDTQICLAGAQSLLRPEKKKF